MKKQLLRGVSMVLLTSTIVAGLPRYVKANVIVPVTSRQQVIREGVLKGVIFLVTGVIAVNATIASCICQVGKDGILQLKRIPRLPDTYKPDGVLEKIHPKTDQVIQRRFYDKDGKPALDIDLYDHNCPEYHPWPQHKHVWKDGVRGHQEPLTDAEYQHYIVNQSKTLMK